MKNFFAISLILVAFVECTLTEALLSSDIVRFKSIAHRMNEFVDIGDKYYAAQLGAELKEKMENVVGFFSFMIIILRTVKSWT